MIGGFDLSDLAFLSATGGKPYGEAVFSTPGGPYTWTAPALVKSVSVVCIGGGGGSPIFTTLAAFRLNGSGGGGLGWRNNIAVTPGQRYTVVVGDGGACPFTGLTIGTGGDGGVSYFISTDTVLGGGGMGARSSDQAFGGTFYVPVNDGASGGGGNGGNGGVSLYSTGYGGCGGAGGYSGNGGNGGGVSSTGSFSNGSSGQASSGAAGGGASANSSTNATGAGGGTGIYGIGVTGIGGVVGNLTASDATHGRGGSTSTDGTVGTRGYFRSFSGGLYHLSYGGLYGGGSIDAGANRTGDSGSSDIYGSSGVVRIIWGEDRAFPSTNVGPSQ